jgi:hypothetical protein
MPSASSNVTQLSAAFACAVTTPTANGDDLIARNGDESLFALFGKLLPQVCRVAKLTSDNHSDNSPAGSAC